MRHHRRHHHQDLEPASDHRCCRCRHTHGIRFGPQLRAWSHPIAHLRFHLSDSLGPQLRTRTGRPSRDRVDFSAQEGAYQSNDRGIVSCSLLGCGCGRGRDHGTAMGGWPLLPCQGVAVAVAVAVAGLLHGIVVDDSLIAAAAVAASMALAQLQSGSGLLQQVVYCASPSHLACLSRIRSSYSFLPVNAR